MDAPREATRRRVAQRNASDEKDDRRGMVLEPRLTARRPTREQVGRERVEARPAHASLADDATSRRRARSRRPANRTRSTRTVQTA